MYLCLHPANYEQTEASNFNYSNEPSGHQDANEDFNDFEEDEVTRKIREEEEKQQNMLREKSVTISSSSKENGRKNVSVRRKAANSLKSSGNVRTPKNESVRRRT